MPVAKDAVHQKSARLGVWACVRNPEARLELARWRKTLSQQRTDHYAKQLAELVLKWSPVIPSDWLLTCPPAGVSPPDRYPARYLAQAIADRLSIRFQECISRTDSKRWHGPAYALRQAPFSATIPPSHPVVIIVDDFITSCTNMRLSLEAVNEQLVRAFGFAFSSH
jgi:hypothetical protein